MSLLGPEYSAVLTLTDGTHTVTLNAASGDTYLVDADLSTGLVDDTVRSNVDDKAQTDGGIVHPAFLGPRHIVLAGMLYVTSASTDSGIVQARNTLAVNLKTVLQTILRADGTLSYTPSGGSSKSVTVRYDVGATFSRRQGIIYGFAFGLVAANPVWA